MMIFECIAIAVAAAPPDIEFAIVSPARLVIGPDVRVEGAIGTRWGSAPGELDGDDPHPLVMRSDFRNLDARLDAALDELVDQLVLHDRDGDNRLCVDDPAEAHGLVGRPRLVDADGDGYVDGFDLFLARFGSDGVGERLDKYAKVHGPLLFAADRVAWEDAHDAGYQTVVEGAIRTGHPPVRFGVDERDLPEITRSMFDEALTSFFEAASGESFAAQVTTQLAEGGEYVEPGPETWEGVPYNSEGTFDYYQRPIFRDMSFTNLVIPIGTNALFESCTFIGVTYVETNEDCDHENWNYAGALEYQGGGVYALKFPDLYAECCGGIAIADTRTESNNIRFHGCTFAGSISGDTPNEHTHWRNRIQFTGATRFVLDDELADDRLLRASSMMLPGWSVHLASPGEAGASLRGTIVADILEATGPLEFHGPIMLTYRPVEGEGPLFYGGLPSYFRSTLAGPMTLRSATFP